MEPDGICLDLPPGRKSVVCRPTVPTDTTTWPLACDTGRLGPSLPWLWRRVGGTGYAVTNRPSHLLNLFDKRTYYTTTSTELCLCKEIIAGREESCYRNSRLSYKLKILLDVQSVQVIVRQLYLQTQVWGVKLKNVLRMIMFTSSHVFVYAWWLFFWSPPPSSESPRTHVAYHDKLPCSSIHRLHRSGKHFQPI